MPLDLTGSNLFFVLALFGAGLFCIMKGGDLFVDAATWIAESTGIPKFSYSGQDQGNNYADSCSFSRSGNAGINSAEDHYNQENKREHAGNSLYQFFPRCVVFILRGKLRIDCNTNSDIYHKEQRQNKARDNTGDKEL